MHKLHTIQAEHLDIDAGHDDDGPGDDDEDAEESGSERLRDFGALNFRRSDYVDWSHYDACGGSDE